MRSYSPDIESFHLCSARNPDCSIYKNCPDSQWLFAVWVFCFAEDTVLFHQNLIANLFGLVLPIISNFIPVSYKWYVKKHVVSKYCCAWRGFKDCMIGRTNAPCRVVKEDINFIGGY